MKGGRSIDREILVTCMQACWHYILLGVCFALPVMLFAFTNAFPYEPLVGS